MLVASTAQAAFLGLDVGDTIDSIGFDIPTGGAVFTDATDLFTISAAAENITTTSPEVLLDIAGGDININFEVVSETLTFLGTGGGSHFYTYDAVFNGESGVTDVEIFAPTGGPNPEQDGRLLISGEFTSQPNSTLTVTFDTLGFATPTFTFGGTFDVTGGDATFQPLFGSLGDLADVIGTSGTSIPSLSSLLSDGFLFSVRDVTLGGGAGDCGGGGSCVGTVLNQTGDFASSGGGEIFPQNPAAFVPEPGTGLLVGVGLLGLAVRRRGAARN